VRKELELAVMREIIDVEDTLGQGSVS